LTSPLRFLTAVVATSATLLMLAGPSLAADSHTHRRTATEVRSARDHRPGTERVARGFGGDVAGVADAVWTLAFPAAVVLGIGGVVLLAVRWRARRRRSYVRLWLVPYRADDAESDAVHRMVESWHQQLIERWWRRAYRGQRGIALEVAMAPDKDGDVTGALAVVCPEELVDSISGTLLACYPDSRLVRSRGGLPPVERVVRLKKRHRFVHALRIVNDDEGNTVDAVLNQMASLRQAAVLQYTLVPTPAWFDLYARRAVRKLERRGGRERRERAPRSEVRGSEIEAALRAHHRPLFFSEARIGASTYDAAAAIAGTIRGQSAAENRFVERYHRPWASGRIYMRWLREGVHNPIPDTRKGVLSSTELAALWRLPSSGLKTVRLARSAVPRLPAPPAISRKPEYTLARDERGSVGILPEDKSDGLGLIGGQKTGKTSLLCRTVRADATDDDCALIVLMPKPGDAEKALSMVPAHRTVHYLDFEHPECGINPLLADGEPAMVADKIVEALRDVNAEGDIRGSSDRYLRQAAQAAIGAVRAGLVDGPPTLWHMYRMLLPTEVGFRERVTDALLPDPRYTDTATFFGQELPHDLEHAAGQTTAKLDAPRNKLLRLMVESLDKVLRHPIQLDLDEIVRRREVLVVDGKMGTFGPDNCRVMMQFILTTLYGTLQRQQQRPEHERCRVALKVDEAHLILNESFANAMATLRSAGLEVVAAWQYGAQIQEPKVRSGMMSLLRQRCMFSMGEEADAREMSTIAMAVYSDMIRTDPESRARMRLTPDTIFNLPNHHAVCSWISRGARVPAFIAQTLPLEQDDAVVRHHLAAQRERGYHVPDALPDPLPDLDWKGLREIPSEEIVETGEEIAQPVAVAVASGRGGRAAQARRGRGAGGGAGSGSGDGGGGGGVAITNGDGRSDMPATNGRVDHDFDPAATSIADANERPGVPLHRAPETFTELDLDDVRSISWDNVEVQPPDRRPEPTVRELEILGALWSSRFLFATQIWRRWWPDSSQRAAQQALNRMTRAGWVRRFKFQVAERGAQQRVYCLARDGFELAKQHTGRRGPYIDPKATWREPQINDPRRILRDLHVSGWVMVFETLAGRALVNWQGSRNSRIDPPRRKVRGEWVDLRPANVVFGTNHVLRDYEPDRFEPVNPDASLELRLQVGGTRLHFDLLVDVHRGGSPSTTEDRLRRYDGFISGWSHLLERYRSLGTPPVVVFVCEDEPSALRLLRQADKVVTARIAKAGTDEATWPFPGRRAMFFAVEREVHHGSLAAFQLPEHPPAMRVRLHGPEAKPCHPRRLHIIQPQLLRRR
jgi:hypothetical protein